MANSNDLTPNKTIPITQWAPEDRPREKMLSQGKKSLTDSELIAILLRTGIKGASAIDLAKLILQRNNNSITNLARLEVADLTDSFKGMGMAKAVTVLAALELGNRMLKENRENKDEIIRNSEDLFRFIAPRIIDLSHEEFWAIYLTQRNKVVWIQRIGMGGLTQTTVDLRIIFKAALEHNAVALAVAHNHPSGQLRPSQADKDLTRRIAEAGNIMHIKLMEHLIVGIGPEGKRDYFSFTENGLL
jgi:DNA repair protein RadC